MKKPQSTRLAKAISALGGWIWRIKYPQRVYTCDFENDSFVTEFAGWRVMGCGWGLEINNWAAEFDRKHYDHWAYIHENCGTPCPDKRCGGLICKYEEPDDEEA